MKAMLFSGFVTCMLIFSDALGTPNFDFQKNKVDLMNFATANSFDSVVLSRSQPKENSLISTINRSILLPKINELENLNQTELLAYSEFYNLDSSVDLNAYSLMSDSLDKRILAAQWNTEFGSSDGQFIRTGTVVVPAPGALLLGSIGAVIVGWLRKSRMISQH